MAQENSPNPASNSTTHGGYDGGGIYERPLTAIFCKLRSVFVKSPNNDPHQEIEKVKKIEDVNKSLVLCFLLCMFLCRTPKLLLATFDGWRVPHSFEHIPTVYAGSRVLLATGFFSAFLGLINSARLRISRFCALYSAICLVFMLLLFFIALLLPILDLPLWFKMQLYFGAISVTSPFWLFFVQLLLLPIAAFSI